MALDGILKDDETTLWVGIPSRIGLLCTSHNAFLMVLILVLELILLRVVVNSGLNQVIQIDPALIVAVGAPLLMYSAYVAVYYMVGRRLLYLVTKTRIVVVQYRRNINDDIDLTQSVKRAVNFAYFAIPRVAIYCGVFDTGSVDLSSYLDKAGYYWLRDATIVPATERKRDSTVGPSVALRIVTKNGLFPWIPLMAKPFVYWWGVPGISNLDQVIRSISGNEMMQ